MSVLIKKNIDKRKDEILKGLFSEQKHISSKYFYDRKGSELFEEITYLDEYYPTRTEKKILRKEAKAILTDFHNFSIIELGSGDCSKISILINGIEPEERKKIAYIPVDVSQSAIEKSKVNLNKIFPNIKVEGVVADFVHHLENIPSEGKKLFCFFGSTIGNLKKKERKKFLKLLGTTMNPGDRLLLGLDMQKDIVILENAYNDKQQVTAAFNKNILNVVNSIVKSNFNPEKFDHLAFYNTENNRIEMHLKALNDMTISFDDDTNELFLKKGETIHTENSYKFDYKDVKLIEKWAKIEIRKILSDANNWFNLVYYQK